MTLKIPKNHKTWILALLAISSAWLAGASARSAKNYELSAIIAAFENTATFGGCSVDIDLRKDWILGWSPSSMNIAVTQNGTSLATTISQHFPPDRIHLPSGNSFYRYTWSAIHGEKVVATILDFEVSRDLRVKNVKLGQCRNYPANHFIGDLHECRSPISALNCS